MIQQVNLYQDCVKPGKNTPELNLYTGSALAFVLFATVYSAYLSWDLYSSKNHLSDLKQTLAKEQAVVSDLITRLPKNELDPLLASQIKEFQSSTAQLRQTLQLLNDKDPNVPDGFSKYFQALSQQAIPEVWLTSIYINEQKHIFYLQGSANKANKVAYFLQQLQKESIFEGQAFAKLTMLKSVKNPDQFDFTVSTSIEPLPEKDHAE
jgi:hypothetical protein